MTDDKRAYIASLFPELELFEDDDLHQRVIDVWVRAMQKGGWDAIDDIPFTKAARTDATLVSHVRTITRLAHSSASILNELHGYGIPLDWILTGALLHDVGKLLEYELVDGEYRICSDGKLVRHPITGAWLALEAGIPAGIVHTISNHSHEGDHVPRSQEGVIIHHMDFTHFEVVKARNRAEEAKK